MSHPFFVVLRARRRVKTRGFFDLRARNCPKKKVLLLLPYIFNEPGNKNSGFFSFNKREKYLKECSSHLYRF